MNAYRHFISYSATGSVHNSLG